MKTKPTFPIYGTNTLNLKARGNRTDFSPAKFDLAIETKGYLLAWLRSAVCPCKPVSTHTEQPDPTCPLCKGSGWYYFGADTPTDVTAIGNLDDVQIRIIQENNAMVIRGLITGIQNEYNPWDKLGNWMAGTTQVTVRRENMIGYYDKIISLDSEIVYSEMAVADGSLTLPTRYLVTGVNSLRTQELEYKADVDYYIDKGDVRFVLGHSPATGTRLGIHYLCHPTWLIIEHPHALRTTLVKYKKAAPMTTEGDMVPLPVQAIMRYDFLPEPT